MMWVFAILIVLAMGSIAVVAAGRGTPMQEAYDDRPDVLVPEDGPIGAGELKAVRFSLAVRGYRMSEVDDLLARLAKQLEDATGAPVPRALPAPSSAPSSAPARTSDAPSTGPVASQSAAQAQQSQQGERADGMTRAESAAATDRADHADDADHTGEAVPGEERA
jgi:DivIVA domain-containing protein